jgi:hypothetical protein
MPESRFRPAAPAAAFLTAAIWLLAPPGAAQAQQSSPLDPIVAIASASTCNGAGNDAGPKAYIRGMALVFARAVCQPGRDDVRVASAARAAPGGEAEKGDALVVFDKWFKQLGMSNDTDGVDTLRHTYVLLLGLGLIESSGYYCKGRYLTDPFDKEDSAESGLFQTSWGAHKHSATLAPMFARYRPSAGQAPDAARCLLRQFGGGSLTCQPKDAKNWGKQGTDGYVWQGVTKQCPAFAAEYAAVVLRTHGGLGKHGEFGPIKCYGLNKKCRKPSLYPACDAMFARVQAYVKDHPDVCASLQ